MATEIKTSIVINASSKKIWNVLTTFEAYPQWNPFIKSIDGELKIQNKLHVQIDGMKFKPRILKVKKNEEIKWIGHLLFPGIFDGTHYFHIIDNGNSTCTFIHGEIFKGLLVPLMKKKLHTDVKYNFEQMNLALKNIVEGF